MAKKPANMSLSISRGLYDQVQKVRREMRDAGSCESCGRGPGNVPLKQAAEAIVRLGLEAWESKKENSSGS